MSKPGSKRPPSVGETLTKLLTESYGFYQTTPGNFFRDVDNQHALVITDKNWDARRTGKLINSTFLSFALARRDINDLWRELYNSELPSPWATVDATSTLFSENYMLCQRRASDEATVWLQFFDEYIPKLQALANLPSINVLIDTLHADGNGGARLPRMMNIMLDGKWDDAAHEEFLAPDIDAIERLPPDHPHVIDCKQRVPLFQAWLEAHPNGIERECSD